MSAPRYRPLWRTPSTARVEQGVRRVAFRRNDPSFADEASILLGYLQRSQHPVDESFVSDVQETGALPDTTAFEAVNELAVLATSRKCRQHLQRRLRPSALVALATLLECFIDHQLASISVPVAPSGLLVDAQRAGTKPRGTGDTDDDDGDDELILSPSQPLTLTQPLILTQQPGSDEGVGASRQREHSSSSDAQPSRPLRLTQARRRRLRRQRQGIVPAQWRTDHGMGSSESGSGHRRTRRYPVRHDGTGMADNEDDDDDEEEEELVVDASMIAPAQHGDSGDEDLLASVPPPTSQQASQSRRG